MNCSKCGGPTKEKQINSARYTGPVYECLSGCMNGRYPLGTFPPRGEAAPSLNPDPGQPPAKNEAIQLLKDIDFKLSRICQALALKNDPLEKIATSDESLDLEPSRS